ncbi:FAD-dependent monooxygenase [Rhizobium lentis]|uniref:FAD-dependent monooxygenase n=1 Tax=Rhizobium lentis TaxID=1138194 RepID=UPI002180B9E0|nr:FAD-dependent monooxygenase [Rhizobium lentis]
MVLAKTRRIAFTSAKPQGDAVHLFTPAGGLGYNTAVDDAVNLGWKLASVVKGNAPSFLLDTYELERRPVAVRNTGFARAFAESIGNHVPKPDIEADSDLGSDLRREAGAYLEAHGRSEFNIPGVTFGARYDHSPIILAEGEGRAPDLPEVYVPNAAPGGRAPHIWLNSQTSLFDRFGFEWTLLRLRPSSSPGTEFVTAARMAGMDLTVVDIKEDQLRAIYREPLVLIRPDQVIAWRGDGDGDAVQIIETVLGHIPAKR